MSTLGRTSQSPASVIRMQNLSERIRSFQDVSKQTRDEAKLQIERALKRLEDQQQKQAMADRNAFTQVKEAMSTAQDAIATQKAQREILDEKKTKEMQVVESSVTVEFNIERQHRKELDEKISKFVDERY